MLHIITKNLAKISAAHGLSPEEIAAQKNHLKDYLLKIAQRNQGFYKVIDDTDVVAGIQAFAQTAKGKFDDLVVLGIGGSALGTLCLEQCFRPFFNDRKKNSLMPRISVLDNIDPLLLAEQLEVLNLERTLFLVVSKSGSTPETIAQYLYFRQQCEQKKFPAKEHFVFITDPKEGFLRKIAIMENIPAFEIPPNVGGRFSVLTAVGLLPAAVCGPSTTV